MRRNQSTERLPESDPAWEYYLVYYDVETDETPFGIVRRRKVRDGTSDEVYRPDDLWHSTGIIRIAKLGMYEKDLKQISAEEALAYLAMRRNAATKD